MNRYYSPDEDLIIKKYAGDKSTATIAAIIGRSRQSVSIRARKLGLSLRQVGEDHYNAKLSNLQVEMIHALSNSGFRVCEIHKAAFNHVVYDTIQAAVVAYNRKIR